MTELACLDLHTGRPLWRVNQDSVGGSVSRIATRCRAVGRAESGARGRTPPAIIWVRGLLSLRLFHRQRRIHFSHTPGQRYGRARSGAEQPTMSIPAMDDDTVFICSNLGSVAAVSLHTGAVRWLLLYERRLEDTVDDGQVWSSQELRSWEFNPLILVNNRVCVLPNDSDRLFVIGKETGTTLDKLSTRRPRRDSHVARYSRQCGLRYRYGSGVF